MVEERIGKVTHYWPRAGAAEVRLEDAALRLGDRIRIRGHGHDFVQTVDSIEVDGRARPAGRPGDHFAIAVRAPVHAADEVFLLRDTGGPKE